MSRRANGEGSVYQRADGRWVGSYYDDNGNRRYVYGHKKIDVSKKLKQKQSNRTIKHDAYLLEEWVKIFLETYKKNEIKITTYNSYCMFFRVHIKGSAVGKKKLDKIKTDDLQQFYNRKIDEGYNSKTVNHIHVILNMALEKAYMLRMIPENPNKFTTIPKRTKYEAKVLSMESVEKLVREAKGDELYPIVITTAYTGMRKGDQL